MSIQRNKNGETVFVFVFDLVLTTKQVYLAGDFNRWNLAARQRRKAKDGTFRAREKLSPG